MAFNSSNIKSKFLVIATILFGIASVSQCSVLDRPVTASSIPDTIAEASAPTETTVSVVLSPPPLVPSVSSVTTATTTISPFLLRAKNQTESSGKSLTQNHNVQNQNTTVNSTTAPSASVESRHDSKVMDIIQMGLTSLRHAGDRLKKFVTKIEAGIKSGALNETIENVKVKIEKGEIDLKKIIHAYKQKSTVGLEQLIKRISDDSHALLDKLHGRVDGHLVGNHTADIPQSLPLALEVNEDIHSKDLQEASETITVLATAPTEADA